MYDIIIPTIHAKHDTGTEALELCIESIVKSKDTNKANIIVKENYHSFAEGINAGLAETRNDVILVNDDIIVSNTWISDIERGIGDIRGFKLLYPPLGQIIQHAGGQLRQDWRGTHIGVGHFDTGQYDQIYPCAYVTFACVLIKRKVIDELGPISTEYGRAYFEDVDYCLQAWRAGFDVIYNPVPLMHYESLSTKKVGLNEASTKSWYKFYAMWGKPDTIEMLRGKIGDWYNHYGKKR